MIQVINIMKKTSCIALLLCLLIASNSTLAEKLNTLEDGQAAFNAGNYTLSFSLWSTLATQGDAEAQVFGWAFLRQWLGHAAQCATGPSLVSKSSQKKLMLPASIY